MAVTEMKDTEQEDIDALNFNMDLDEDELDALDEEEYEEEEGEDEEPEEKKAASEEDPPKDEEESDEDYSKRVTKRINKLTFRAKSAEEREEAARKEAAKYKKEALELRAKQEESDIEGLKHKQKAAKTRLQHAYDDGEDATEIAEAQAELSEVSAEIAFAKRQKTKSPEVDEEDQKEQKDGPSPVAKAWVDENKGWFNKPENKVYRAAAIAIEGDLKDEGYSIDDEDLYEELDRRLAVAMPGIKVLRGDAEEDDVDNEDTADDKKSLKKRGQQVVAGQGRGGEGVRKKKSVKRLNQDDLKSMQTYGFDPHSPEDRKAWLNRNKI